MTRDDVDYIAVHCAATGPNMDIGVAEIREWHKERGWSDVGYHFIIRRDGTLEFGRELDEPGAHVRGFNYSSLGVCMIGGVDSKGVPENNFTDEQFSSLESLLTALKVLYPLAKVRGHRDFPGVTKQCPCFDVETWLQSVRLQ